MQWYDGFLVGLFVGVAILGALIWTDIQDDGCVRFIDYTLCETQNEKDTN